MLDPVDLTDHVEAHWMKINGVPVTGFIQKLDDIFLKVLKISKIMPSIIAMQKFLTVRLRALSTRLINSNR
jgi:hypothetical protein